MGEADRWWKKENATRSEYLSHFGANKADAKEETQESKPDRIEKALEKAHDIRKFEIDLYWKRAAYFWAFSAAAFAGYFALQKTQMSPCDQEPLYLLSCLGFSFSLAWYFVNRGSTTWQRNWEKHVDLLENEVTGPLYKMTLDRNSYKFWRLNSGYPFSPSKINGIIAAFIIVIWFALAVRAFCYQQAWDYVFAAIVGATVACLWQFGRTSPDDEVITIEYGIRRYKGGPPGPTTSPQEKHAPKGNDK
jgi:hypothetical protein